MNDTTYAQMCEYKGRHMVKRQTGLTVFVMLLFFATSSGCGREVAVEFTIITNKVHHIDKSSEQGQTLSSENCTMGLLFGPGYSPSFLKAFVSVSAHKQADILLEIVAHEKMTDANGLWLEQCLEVNAIAIREKG